MAVGESWGRYPPARQQVLSLRDIAAPLPEFSGHALPHGNGRSYGDSCLDDGGTLLLTRGLDRFIAFDEQTGVLRCEAGVLFSEILDELLPRGWFLPVTPGTRFVTVGGAIANDIHGKNHAHAGSFGDDVLAFELLRSDGTREICRPGDARFAATVAGLGLTGLITWAEIRLRRVAGPWMDSEQIRFGRLGEFFALSAESTPAWEYSVAWIDCLARGPALGRGLFQRANHAADAGAGAPKARRELPMPVTPPLSLVNPLSLRAFNTLYFRRQFGARRSHRGHYASYFYPLDGIRDWNRMYGPRGFVQYQCVLPPAAAEAGVGELLQAISKAGQGSFLAVLKQFGDRRGPGMLSFPRPGTTLALDFPNGHAALPALLERLDAIVADAGGAVYPAKDARWPGHRFRAAYPRWQEFAAHLDPRFSSGFWRRAME